MFVRWVLLAKFSHQMSERENWIKSKKSKNFIVKYAIHLSKQQGKTVAVGIDRGNQKQFELTIKQTLNKQYNNKMKMIGICLKINYENECWKLFCLF